MSCWACCVSPKVSMYSSFNLISSVGSHKILKFPSLTDAARSSDYVDAEGKDSVFCSFEHQTHNNGKHKAPSC